MVLLLTGIRPEHSTQLLFSRISTLFLSLSCYPFALSSLLTTAFRIAYHYTHSQSQSQSQSPQTSVWLSSHDYSLNPLAQETLHKITVPPYWPRKPTLFAMPLLEPITFSPTLLRGANGPQHVIPEKAEDITSPNTRSMMGGLQPLVIPSGISSLSRSDPPTPPRGPPPTPRRRAIYGLSRSDPPTPPRGSPPTSYRRDAAMINSLSRRDPPSPPNGPPPTPRRREGDMFNSLSRRDPPSPPRGPPPSPGQNDNPSGFNSLSRRDPPTPPSGPPPSPCRRDIFNALSRRDPPTPPRGPPPSPRRREAEIYTGLSRSDPPSPPRAPPPTPTRCFGGRDIWTKDEMDLLAFVCRSSVKLVS